MASRIDFCNVVTDIYKTHGVYVWGGNGEYLERLTVGKIHDMEDTDGNAARVFRFIAGCYDKGWNMTKSRCVDCSGLVIAGLRTIGAISANEDYRARDLQKMSKPIELNKLRPGDLVFNKMEAATHCGVYDGYDMVIEAMGRDKSITRTKLSSGKWVIGGSLKFFE